MNKDQFWGIIDSARQEAGHWKDMRAPLQEALFKLDAPEILRWQRILEEYMGLSYKEKLRGAALVMMKGCSDDGFDYFRGWLAAQGKEAFLGALSNPDSLAGLEAARMFANETHGSEYTPINGYQNSPSFESMLYVAVNAYESKPDTGDFYDALYECELSARQKADIAGEIIFAKDIDVEPGGSDAPYLEKMIALRQTFPELYALFNDVTAPQIQNYDIIHSIRIGGAAVMFMENKAIPEPYLVCERSWANPLGVDEFKNTVAGDDFLEMMRVFSDRLSGRIAVMEEEWNARGIPFEKLSAEDCVPDGLASDLEGKVIVLKPEKLSPEYRTIDYQLALCTGGFGARPDARGRKVYCTELYSGKQETFNRDAIAGVFPLEGLPDWAREKLAALQKLPERESVIAKIREGKNAAPPREPRPKSRGKDGPEI